MEFTVDVPVAEGVRIFGRIDRLERDAEGALHVVDFKTAKQAISNAAAETQAQLRTYQLALASGEIDGEQVTEGEEHPTLGGAELVYPGTGKGAATVRAQSALDEESAEAWRAELRRVLHDLTGPLLRAQPNENCERICPLMRICPAYPEGRTVTLPEPTASSTTR